MTTDPILREVYRAKEQFAREIGNDVDRLFERLSEEEKEHPERMAQLAPQAPKPNKRRTARRKAAE